ncbi:3-keto-5-aminohexanoate cleavage protein [Patescibacteria group bacterium]|nr:3-keto-5-aminohexanoate cleavage protein [Patescibacteria group bacterium]MBU1934581.1 3-keto-5-aminohexanoate cleavage protein [Patescibacteria group bacterium]
MEKLIINFTPTGMIPNKDMTPHVPITPEEIADDVLRAAQLGASMVHLHGRDKEGEPTNDKGIYEEIIGRIKEKNKDIIICVSTSGRNGADIDKRSEVLDISGNLKPDMASLTLSSLNFNKEASLNCPNTIKMLAEKMLERGIKPELEAFDIGMINYANYLIKKGLLKPPYYFNLFLGNIACAQANLLNVGLMLSELPEDSIWSLAGVGDHQTKMNTLAVVQGGGVRVGLEDNIWFDQERTQLATNDDLVKRIANTAKAIGREIASPQEVRKMLNL